MEEISFEQKNIIENIVNNLINVINLAPFREKISSFIKKQYDKGLEQAEVEFQMNFVPDDKEVGFLNDYVFNNLKFNTDSIGNNLREELSRALMNKESISQVKARVRNVFKDNIYENRLKTVLRTEGIRATEAGSLAGAQQSGLKLKKYLDVILDDSTSPICRSLNMKYGNAEQGIALDKEFVTRVQNKTIRSLHSPFHPNCRTVLRYKQVEG